MSHRTIMSSWNSQSTRTDDVFAQVNVLVGYFGANADRDWRLFIQIDRHTLQQRFEHTPDVSHVIHVQFHIRNSSALGKLRRALIDDSSSRWLASGAHENARELIAGFVQVDIFDPETKVFWRWIKNLKEDFSFCSLTKGVTPKISRFCFVLINSVLLNRSCVWIFKLNRSLFQWNEKSGVDLR